MFHLKKHFEKFNHNSRHEDDCFITITSSGLKSFACGLNNTIADQISTKENSYKEINKNGSNKIYKDSEKIDSNFFESVSECITHFIKDDGKFIIER